MGLRKDVWRKDEKEGESEQHFVTGYHRLISHEHLLQGRVWCISWECLSSHLSHTPHTHTHALHAHTDFYLVAYFCLFLESSGKGRAAFKRATRAVVCVCVGGGNKSSICITMTTAR